MLRQVQLFILASVFSLQAWCGPAFLLTHNETDLESNAYIITHDGSSIPSIYPTKPHSHSKVYWNMVKLACHGHTVGGQCTAMVKMATNTPNPIDVGLVTLDLATGEITTQGVNPKEVSYNGYTVRVNGPAETTITKN